MPNEMPDQTPDQIRRIPLAEIDDEAMPRDRTGLDPEPMAELRASILASGLRMPVELYPLEHPDTRRWGIISGFRRIATFRELNGAWELPGYDTIPALIRPRRDEVTRIVSMIEENEIRADLSPWEKGRVAADCWRRNIFPTVEEAVERLYPAADKVKRARLRALARLVVELDGLVTDPEKLSQRQAMRIHAAMGNGFTGVIQTALEQARGRSFEQQREILQPILRESELGPNDAPDFDFESPNRGRPRRVARLPTRRIVIRRERAEDGYILRFTGRDATTAMLDLVFDEIERMFAPE